MLHKDITESFNTKCNSITSESFNFKWYPEKLVVRNAVIIIYFMCHYVIKKGVYCVFMYHY